MRADTISMLKAAESRRAVLLRRLDQLPAKAKRASAYNTIMRLVGPTFIAAKAKDRGALIDGAEFMLSVLESLPRSAI